MDWTMAYDAADVPAWIQPTVDIYLWPLIVWVAGATILLLLVAVVTSLPVRRRFWCEEAGREVEAAFEEDGPPGHRRYVAVVSCTAFEPATCLRCQRSCLDTLLPP